MLPIPRLELENLAVPRSADVGIVGIYSLDEAASHRAITVLKSLYSDLDVRVNADSVCTAQLKSLAQRAAIFIFAWKSSKHAAYFCIKAASRPGQALEMAQGAGTSSMVDAAVRSILRMASLDR
jgi:galactitol-specific phosphotransferase system IIB component